MAKQVITLLIMISFSSFSQAQSDYNNLWKQVEKLEAQGLPKSAQEVVEKIQNLSVKENNDSQTIKTLLYKSKYALILEEDATLKVIEDFKLQIEKSQTPTKNILKNMLANLYWQYFQQNRYRFYNRSKTETKVDAVDFRTWDLQNLFNEIDFYFQKSLVASEILKKTPLKNYDVLLQTEKNSKLYRPTLFDFLTQNALQFYETDENSISKPAYKFTIENSAFLDDAASFSKLPISHQDSTSLQFKALKIYQQLIAFHLKDKNPLALASVDIQRLKFVYENGTFLEKERLFLKALSNAAATYQNHEVSALYNYEIAAVYYLKGQNYDPKNNPEDQWRLKEAIDICNAVIKNFPDSNGAKKCALLKSEIETPTMELRAEDNIPIERNSLLLLRYSNLNTLKFKIFKLTDNAYENFLKLHRQPERFKFIKSLNAAKEWDSSLKNEQDFQKHSTEIVVPKLTNGKYLIVATPDFSKEDFFAFKMIQATDFAMTSKNDRSHEIFQVINRSNGAPVVGAKVTVSYQKNYNNVKKTLDFKTDQKGEFRVTDANDSYYNMDITVSHLSQIAHFKDYYNNHYYNDDDDDEEEAITFNPFLFTDRSIYRPGQVVYFKGIATKREGSKTTVYANKPATISLKNVNGEVVKELQLITNDFGSVSGEFMLPNTGLTGSYVLEMDAGSKGSTTFSVEEYKRPKFKTAFDNITKIYTINDSVTVNGKAEAYAGSAITDAKVVYRVHRKVQYPPWFYWYRPAFNGEPQEIAHGETVTDSKGHFNIQFKAIPDESVAKDGLPVFHYEITAEVTDINGETRSATTLVNVGYHSFLAHLEMDSQLDQTKKDHLIKITTENLNGEFVPAQGDVKIYKLKAPSHVLRNRSWPAPDYPLLSKEAFKNLFPHEAYQNENQKELWDKGALVFETPFNTAVSKELQLEAIKKWKSGNYMVLLESKDKDGQLVKDQKLIYVFNPEDATLPDQQLFAITTDHSHYKVGQNVILTVASAAKNITVTVDIEKNNKTVKTHIIPLDNSKKTIAIPVLESDLGGFAVHYSFAFSNSFTTGTQIISVPYPKSELEIETNTFRDKLEPGASETWSFTVKGPQGEKVSAELLASMYDMSLDQFSVHQWAFKPLFQQTYYSYNQRSASESFGTDRFNLYLPVNQHNDFYQQYDQWNWFGLYLGGRRYGIMTMARKNNQNVQLEVADSEASMDELQEVVVTGYGEQNQLATPPEPPMPPETVEETPISIRKNLQETAFFFPKLQTDAEGQVSFSFTTPEALTRWKLQLLAHTKSLESATTSLETITQKELMVIPNAPRFLRQGDQISISTKIANLTDKTLSGEAELQLFDAVTAAPINTKLQNLNSNKTFTVDSNGNIQISWSLKIPDDVDAVQYKIIAKSGTYSDGEQNVLPVLSNRMLVTETLPMWVKSNETRTFTLDKLASSSSSAASSTLKNHKLILEMTSNPAWYAVQALPYLMEYPFDCNEQIFSRYYANALANHIATSNPRVKAVFDQWASQDALLSNLEKNQELKSILIQETPWLRDAQSETEQKKRIALLFDMNKMSNELQASLSKLKNNQMSNGAWSWFQGGRENRFITQQIIAGFGHLKQLNVISDSGKETSSLITKAISYLDNEFVREYNDLTKYDKKVDLSKNHLSYTQLHYLYMRSFFPDIAKSKEVQNITNYYQSQIQKYWLSQSLYAKGLMALVSHRSKDAKTAHLILKSLKENSITSDELGMYWKENQASWFWYQAPIETQALMIEAFAEIQNDIKTVDNLKIWLLKNKQTTNWKTTKATAEAVYALLLQGSDWLSVTDAVDVVVGNKELQPSKLTSVGVEAGTGYYKTSWDANEIKPEMATVTLAKKGEGIAWGSLYWQYFEDLDHITFAKTPLQISKKLFLKTNTDLGEQISEVTSTTKLKVGDLIRVRIELRSDRAMEYLHMKDMRAAGFEPVNVLSSYKYQDGLGYYESTKDAATHFFFDYLPKGIYVFEYDLRINNRGDMSNGITLIESMYAPEFTSHSEGVRVQVE